MPRSISLRLTNSRNSVWSLEFGPISVSREKETEREKRGNSDDCPPPPSVFHSSTDCVIRRGSVKTAVSPLRSMSVSHSFWIIACASWYLEARYTGWACGTRVHPTSLSLIFPLPASSSFEFDRKESVKKSAPKDQDRGDIISFGHRLTSARESIDPPLLDFLWLGEREREDFVTGTWLPLNASKNRGEYLLLLGGSGGRRRREGKYTEDRVSRREKERRERKKAEAASPSLLNPWITRGHLGRLDKWTPCQDSTGILFLRMLSGRPVR